MDTKEFLASAIRGADIEYSASTKRVAPLSVWVMDDAPSGIMIPAVSYSHLDILEPSVDTRPMVSISNVDRSVYVIIFVYEPPVEHGLIDNYFQSDWPGFKDTHYDFSYAGLIETGLDHSTKDINCSSSNEVDQVNLAMALGFKAIAISRAGLIAVLRPVNAKGWISIRDSNGERVTDISIAYVDNPNKVMHAYIYTRGKQFANLGFAAAEGHTHVKSSPPAWLDLITPVVQGVSRGDVEELRTALLRAGFDRASINSLDRYIAKQK
ncbi:MAG: hypothetical protein ACRETA_05840 [Gammaproteobacteria bacterium]